MRVDKVSNPVDFAVGIGDLVYSSLKVMTDRGWRVEQNNAAVQYTGDWATNTDPNHSGGSAALTLVNSVTLSFSGTGVRWIGFSDQWSGIADVYVDGVLEGSIDTYSSTSRYQVVQFTITGLASGNHTLKIQGNGDSNSVASSSWVWVDAFEYAN